MASYYREGKSFTVVYDGRLDGRAKGKRAYIYGLKTERLARLSKQKKDQEEELLRAGLFTPDAQLAGRKNAEAVSLVKHVQDFERSIFNRGKEPRYAQQQASHVTRLAELSGARQLSRISAECIQSAAKQLMDEFGLGPRTANAAIKAMRQFSTWLFTSGRLSNDVLHRRLETFNEDVDLRRQRRALTDEEVRWLLDTTVSAEDFVSRRCGIKPADRAMLYAIGMGTGYRQSALLTLTKASFHVDEELVRPFVRLAAAFSKKRRDRDQPIRQDLAASIRRWLKEKPDAGPVWTVSPHADLALRFRRDMERARAAWIEAGKTPTERKRREEDPRTLRYVYHDGVRNVWADFHGLRHTGITCVVRHAGLRVGQAWADHSTPVLTAKYAHMELIDEDKALDALPPALSPDPAREPQQANGQKKSRTRKAG